MADGSKAPADVTPTLSGGRGHSPLNEPQTAPEHPTGLEHLGTVGPNVGFNGDAGNVLEAGMWPDMGPAFPLISPQIGPSGFPRPATPAKPPFDEIAVPQHVSTGAWQMSFYDPTSQADASVWKKPQNSGVLDINTGKTVDTFHQGKRRFRQT